MASEEKKEGLVADGVHVHSVAKTQFDPAILSQPYETPYQLHRDGFSEAFLNDALSKIQHKLFGKWGLIGEKGGNDVYADRSSVYIFGMVYGRGVLDIKTRGLMVMASLCVLQRENVMPTWCNACRNLGWSENELNELGAMVSHIGGFPPSRSALMIFEHIFGQRKDSVEASDQLPEGALATSDKGELYRKACERAIELFGTPEGDLTDLPIDADDHWSKEMRSWVFGYLFGERSAIRIKPKVLAFLAMCSASGRYDMLRRWLTPAQRTGSSYEEVQEVILTTAIYGGWPVARESLNVLKQHWPGNAVA